MALTEKLRLLIEADPKNAVRGLEKMGAAAEREGRRSTKNLDKVGATLSKVGAAMLGLGTLAAVGLVKAAQKTSDLNEAIGLTEDIFGSAADEIGEFAEGAADAIGQSERAAREATATFGGLLDNMGFASKDTVQWSKDLTVLASDLGSAFNRDPAEAVQALGSALRGESEPIRAFNVQLDDASVRAKAVELGLADTKAEVDNYGKAQGRLALIMEQTDTVQGNFAKTADGLANSTRTASARFEDFQANLGQAMLPVLESVSGAANDLLRGFNDLDPGTQRLITKFALFGAGGLALVGVLSSVAGQVISARKAFQTMGTAMKTTTKGVGLLAVAVGVAIVAWHAYGEKARAAKARTEGLVTVLKSGADSVEDLAQSLAESVDSEKLGWLDDYGVSFFDLVTAAQAGESALDEYVESVEAAAVASGKNEIQAGFMRKSIRKLGQSVLDASGDFETFEGITSEASVTSGHAAARMSALGDSTSVAGDAAEATGEQAEGLNSELDEWVDAAAEARAEIDRLIGELGRLFGETTSVIEAESAFHASLEALKEQLGGTSGELDVLTEAGRENIAVAVEAKNKASALAQAYLDQGDDAATAEGRMRIYAGQIRRSAREAGLSEAAIDKMTTAMGLAPSQITTTFQAIDLAANQNAFQKWKTGLDNIDGKTVRTTLVHTRIERTERQYYDDGRRGGPQRATGGRVSAGDVVRVGERNEPEIFRSGGKQFMIPPENGQVVGGTDTRRMGRGGGGSVVINVQQNPGESAAALADRIAAAHRRGFV